MKPDEKLFNKSSKQCNNFKNAFILKEGKKDDKKKKYWQDLIKNNNKNCNKNQNNNEAISNIINTDIEIENDTTHRVKNIGNNNNYDNND